MAEGEEDYSSELHFEDEEKKKGCTAGRAVNGCIIVNYFFLMLSALIVTATMAVLHSKVSHSVR